MLERVSDDWKKVFSVFVQARVAATVAAALSLSAIPARPILEAQNHHKESYPKLIELLIGVWERADAMWYLGIAKQGYVDPAGRAFLPLYPFLIRVVNALIPGNWPGHDVSAALLISNLCFLLALYFVYQLAKDELGSESKAHRAITYLAFFPGSFFFFAPYTESLFLFLASACLWRAREKRWEEAAIFGLLLGLTRNLGAAIVLPLFLELVRQKFWRKIAWLFLVPVGILGWMLWSAHASGDALAFVHEQAQWQRESLAPWKTFWKGLEQAWDYCLAFPGGGYVYEAISVLGAFCLGVYGAIKRTVSLPLLVWIALTLVAPLLAPYEGRMLMSCSRFVAVIFPVFIVLAKLVEREWLDRTIQAAFLAAYGIALAMFVSGQYMY